MKRYLISGMIPALSFGLSIISVEPENRIRISAMSERLIVIDCVHTEWLPAEIVDGVEYHELVIRGSIAEVVRGSAPKKSMVTRCVDVRVIDEAAHQRAHGGADAADPYRMSPRSIETGAADVKRGERYLILDLAGIPYFEWIDKSDTTWRGKILDLSPELQRRRE